MAERSGFQSLLLTWSNRDFRLFAIGNVVSGIGLWVQRLAIGWLTWELTGSATWLGAIAFAEMVPSLILSLFAGTVVDRVDYFKLLRLTQLCTLAYAAIIAALSMTGLIGIWLLFALTLLRGIMLAFNRPSRMTVVYALVGREMLPPALAVNSIIWNGTRFLGPAIGGLIISVTDVAWSLVFAAALFLIFSWLLTLINVDTHRSRKTQRGSLMAETMDGMRYVWSHHSIRLQLTILTIVALCAKPLTDMLPAFSGQIFNLGPHGLAGLLVMHGLGAVGGALYVASRKRGLEGMPSLSIFSILAIAVFLGLFVATDTFWIACLLVGLVSFFFIVQNVSNQTLIQSAIDSEMRGRVMSLYGLIVEAVPAIGSLIVGILSSYLGLRWPFFAGAILCAVAWLWGWRKRASITIALP